MTSKKLQTSPFKVTKECQLKESRALPYPTNFKNKNIQKTTSSLKKGNQTQRAKSQIKDCIRVEQKAPKIKV